MPGKPIQEKLLTDIEAAGGWDAICERVASGENQTAIAESFGVTQGFFSRVMHLDPARVRAYRDAKREAAHVLAEQARMLADGVPEQRDAIAKVREQIGVRRWLSASWNREDYGEAGLELNVNNVTNIAQLHVDALRHRSVEASRPLGQITGPSEEPPADPADAGDATPGFGN